MSQEQEGHIQFLMSRRALDLTSTGIFHDKVECLLCLYHLK